MRHKMYFRLLIAEGILETKPFDASHYREANALVTPLIGMHESSALSLINKWNRNEHSRPKYMYYL